MTKCLHCYRELKLAKDTNIWLAGPDFVLGNNSAFICNEHTWKCAVCGINASLIYEYNQSGSLNFTQRCDYHLLECDNGIISFRILHKLISVEEEQVYFIMTD